MLSIQGRRKLFVKNLREQIYVTDVPITTYVKLSKDFVLCS